MEGKTANNSFPIFVMKCRSVGSNRRAKEVRVILKMNTISGS
jgi:hypothetical protein